MDPPRRGEDGVHAVYVGSELPTDVPYVAHARDGAAIPFDPESDDETLAGEFLAVEVDDDGVFAFCEVVAVE